MDEEYWEKRQEVLLHKAEYLRKEFELSERTEEEVRGLFEILNRINKIKSKSSDCQAQFEDAIGDAHASYDFAVMYGCPLIALATGGGGLVPCYAAAVVKANLEVADAIDDYYACTGDQ